MANDVQIIGYYGSDETHALSAWTSTGRDLSEERRTRIPTLLKMLAENNHHTPFEKSALHFLVRCDTATHIQIIKHRIGVSVNAESARYKEIRSDTSHIPDDWPETAQSRLRQFTAESYRLYHLTLNELVEAGVSRKRAKESARFFLTYSNQLTLDVMFNFRSFMHFVGLRNKTDAQIEVQQIASEMIRLVRGTGSFNSSLAAFGY